jgi:hypothetical protein
MAILEEIAFSAGKPAETKTAILITNRQHQNSPFSGQKPALLDVPAVLVVSGGQWCAQDPLC